MGLLQTGEDGMKAATLYFSAKGREQELARALVAGFERHGVSVRSKQRKEFGIDTAAAMDDLAVFVGVKSLRIWKKCADAGRPTMIIDKSYFDRGDYMRMSVGGFQPPYLCRMQYDSTRLDKMGVRIKPKRFDRAVNHILFAGSSQKYCSFHGLGDVSDYAVEMCKQINWEMKRSNIRRKLIYRPKPSWWANEDPAEKKVIPPDTKFSGPDEMLAPMLDYTHCLVTHGSNAAIEALAAGVPVLLSSPFGISAVYDLCEHELFNIHNPYFPTDQQRRHRLSQLAWCQFDHNEIASGFAWDHVSRWLSR